MHIFQNDLALGESDELLANLGIGQSVQSIGLCLHDAGHLVKLTFQCTS